VSILRKLSRENRKAGVKRTRYRRVLIASTLCLASGSLVEAPQLNGTVPNIVPKPVSSRLLTGNFLLTRQTRLVSEGAEARRTADLFNDHLYKTYGFKLQVESEAPRAGSSIHFTADGGATLPAEGYRLTADTKTVKVVGQKAGLFYGMQSLIQLLPLQRTAPLTIPRLEIADYPRLRYRGMHLDVGRHFFPVEFIKKYLDLMAQYKMNYFHWHLTEDQGWRIEIKKYPKLTEIGSRRKETVKDRLLDPYVGDGVPYGGYYTQEQIKEVVAYAQARFISVMPEIEMPGHALAALAAYPELSCTGGPFEVGTTWGVYKDVFCPKEDTFKFLEDVLTEVIALFPGPYVHIGGDECPKDRWRESNIAQAVIKREGLKDEHELQSYFIRRIEKFLSAKGKRLVGWDEILEGGIAPNATVMSWRGEKGGIEAARQKHDVIMTPGDYCYFDHGQGNPDREPLHICCYLPLKKVYSYNPVPDELKPDEQRYILGAQANVWTEYMKTPDKVEYMVFPRMLALSEAVWSPLERKDYRDFLNRLPHQLARLDKQQVSYRIPEPEGVEDVVTSDEKRTVRLTSYVPGSRIHYSLDGSEPDEQSPIHQQPLQVSLQPDQKVTLNTIVITANGRRSAVYSASLARRSTKEPLRSNGPSP
jgi:hexosaminidase